MAQLAMPYSPQEKLADGCVHAVGIIASVTAAGLLVGLAFETLPALSIASVSVYAATLMSLFIVSASYHMVTWPPLKGVLQRFDHAAIYFKIAGTYTPLALIKMAGLPGYTLLAGVWAVGLVGASFKLFWPQHLVRTSYALYLVAGWAGLLALDHILDVMPVPVLILLGAGGLLYTFGIVFHLWRSLPYHNAVWHGFVLAASACHYAAIICVVAREVSA